ncbi:MAG TPA: HIRAN domain-containing protein [Longimicrobiaceae bacterium]
MIPTFPADHPSTFRTTVHGTVFGERAAHLAALEPGDRLVLIPDPPGEEDPAVWVHLETGDPVGHLPPEINAWLAPWLLRGGSASAVAVKVGGAEEPSWKRLLIEVRCREE